MALSSFTAIPVLTPLQKRRLVNGVIAVVVVSVAWAAAGAVWRIAGKRGGAPNPPPVIALQAPRPAIDLSGVFALAPFGAPARLAQGDGTGVANLVLKAVFQAGQPEMSSAMIAANGAPAKGYRIGETVDGGAVLDTVAIDHVTLRVGGQSETLAFLPRTAVGAINPAMARTAMGFAPQGAPPGAGASNLVGGLPASVAAPIPGGPTPASNLASIQAMRQRASDNPQAVLAGAGAAATAQGYRVGPNLSPEMRQVGLAPGDLIKKVNGSPVGDIDKDHSVLDAAIASGGARVELVRGGRTVTLSFPLR